MQRTLKKHEGKREAGLTREYNQIEMFGEQEKRSHPHFFFLPPFNYRWEGSVMTERQGQIDLIK